MPFVIYFIITAVLELASRRNEPLRRGAPARNMRRPPAAPMSYIMSAGRSKKYVTNAFVYERMSFCVNALRRLSPNSAPEFAVIIEEYFSRRYMRTLARHFSPAAPSPRCRHAERRDIHAQHAAQRWPFAAPCRTCRELRSLLTRDNANVRDGLYAIGRHQKRPRCSFERCRDGESFVFTEARYAVRAPRHAAPAECTIFSVTP